MKYRKLKKGERIRKGDEAYFQSLGGWQETCNYHNGDSNIVGEGGLQGIKYRRLIKAKKK